ncbi:MAG TPA: hypothetical protein VJ934_11040 [Desulfomicrobiaceae bacterium]|nr:hypothetical protein [Desulfomicrobiaceae bacterium]
MRLLSIVSGPWFLLTMVATTFLLGLGLVLVNIERVDLGYKMKQVSISIAKGQELLSKLEVERNNLVAPSRLRRKGSVMGLAEPRPGQVRKLP